MDVSQHGDAVAGRGATSAGDATSASGMISFLSPFCGRVRVRVRCLQ
jgi:hypothetical protein